MPRFISSPTASKTSKQNHWNWDHQHQQTIIFSYTNYGIFLHLKCTEGSKEGEQYWWLDWFLYSIFFLLLFLSIQGTLYVSWRDRTPNLLTSRRPALPRKQQPPQYWQQKCLNMLQLKNIQRPQSSFQDLVEHLKWDSAVWGLLWHVQSWDAEKGRIWTGTHPKALKGRGKSFKNSMSVCTLTIIIWVSIWYY